MTHRLIFINAKFMRSGPTAVHRAAMELSNALMSKDTDKKFVFIAPRGPIPITTAEDFQIQYAGRFRGILWEQISLPFAKRDTLLLNFCNMTPLFLRNAMTMVHDAQVFTSPRSYGGLRGAWARLHIRLAGRLQRGLLTVSEFAKSELVGLGIAPADRIHVIHNGVDHILRVSPEDGVLDRIGVISRNYALGLSNTMAHKNTGVLLRAFSRPEMADMKLVLAGKGTASDFAAMKFTIPPNVIFPGYVTDGEMRSLQAHALAVCTPSLTEGFGMPPVEGMLLGTPAIIAPCGALPEVCGPDTLQADPQDPAAWARAIIRLQNELGLWQHQSDTGRVFAAQFTWAAAATRVQCIID
jgi:glycosyltransferase involved in cell wall biosynthesis